MGSLLVRWICAPPIDTSTPHSSWRYSVEASDEMVSTMNSAGCLAASIAWRISSIGERQPVDVSLWSTHTALILCPASLRRCASISLGSAPMRQSVSMNSGSSPSRFAMLRHSVAKWPVLHISTRSPGESVLTSAPSHAPVPVAV